MLFRKKQGHYHQQKQRHYPIHEEEEEEEEEVVVAEQQIPSRHTREYSTGNRLPPKPPRSTRSTSSSSSRGSSQSWKSQIIRKNIIATMKNRIHPNGSNDDFNTADRQQPRSVPNLGTGSYGGGGRPPLAEHHSQSLSRLTGIPRRASILHRKAPSLSSYQTTPISKHYELNNQILSAFESHYNNKVYRIAYAIGIQFVETALFEIPKHGYFYSHKHERERMQLSLDALSVTQQLMELQKNADVYDISDPEHVQKLSELAMAQVQDASNDQLIEEQRKKAESEIRLRSGQEQQQQPQSSHRARQYHNKPDQNRDYQGFVLCEPMLAAYDSFTNVLCPVSPSITDSKQTGTGPSSHQQQLTQQQHQDAVAAAAAAKATSAEPVVSTAVPYNNRVNTAPAWSPEDWEGPSSLIAPIPSPPPPPPMEFMQKTSSGVAVPPPPLLRGRSSSQEGKQQQQNQQQNDRSVQRLSLLSDSGHEQSLSNLSNLWMKQNNNSMRLLNASSEDLLLEKALYLSGLEVTPTVSMDPSTNSSGTAGGASGDAAAVVSIGDYYNFERDDDSHERVGPPSYEHAALHDQQQYGWASYPKFPSGTPGGEGSDEAGVLELATLARFYHEDFDHLVESKQIRVNYVETYQGRLPDSTNGCTVIAPLLCIHHLLEDPDQIPDPGLPDAVIKHVIDVETPAILTELRTKLGLSPQAFLIPSDAHDYLIECGQLCQEQFITVIGGNILNENHVQAFVTSLEDYDTRSSSKKQRRRKIAATFFFHEHVVAILKARRDHNNTCWYDLIDGLPLKQTLAKIDESDGSFSRRLGLSESQEFLSDAFLPKTARVRCVTSQALIAYIRWYACSKFSSENISYIDQYPWDDKSCDFDPRVFQGFVWGSMT